VCSPLCTPFRHPRQGCCRRPLDRPIPPPVSGATTTIHRDYYHCPPFLSGIRTAAALSYAAEQRITPWTRPHIIDHPIEGLLCAWTRGHKEHGHRSTAGDGDVGVVATRTAAAGGARRTCSELPGCGRWPTREGFTRGGKPLVWGGGCRPVPVRAFGMPTAPGDDRHGRQRAGRWAF
jgi:hypothetical protein